MTRDQIQQWIQITLNNKPQTNLLNTIEVDDRPTHYLNHISTNQLKNAIKGRHINRPYGLFQQTGIDQWVLLYQGKDANDCYNWHKPHTKVIGTQYAIIRIQDQRFDTGSYEPTSTSMKIKRYTAKDFDNQNSPRHIRLCEEHGFDPNEYK